MPHTIKWAEDFPKVLQVDVYEDVQWHEIYEVLELVESMTRDVDSYDLLFVSHTTVPKENPLPHLRHLHDFIRKNPKLRTLVNVDPQSGFFIESATLAIFRISGFLQNVYITRSFEDGINFIKKYQRKN